jgi:hypothetical protein
MIDLLQIKELISSLAWYDCSNYHSENVKRILSTAFPGHDFTQDLDLFVKDVYRVGPGSPRIGLQSNKWWE